MQFDTENLNVPSVIVTGPGGLADKYYRCNILSSKWATAPGLQTLRGILFGNLIYCKLISN